MRELLKLPELSDLLFGFSHRDGCGQGLTDGFALHFIGQPQVGTVAGIIGLRTVAGRLSTTPNDAGDGTRTKIVQFGDGAQQVAFFLLQLRKGRWHTGPPILNVSYTFRTRPQKRNDLELPIFMSHTQRKLSCFHKVIK